MSSLGSHRYVGVLTAEFFDRLVDRVARYLLGVWLVMPGPDGRPTRHVVFEIEAYLGPTAHRPSQT